MPGMEPQPFDVFSADCPSRAAWEHVTAGKKGTVFGGVAEVGVKIDDLLAREAKL